MPEYSSQVIIALAAIAVGNKFMRARPARTPLAARSIDVPAQWETETASDSGETNGMATKTIDIAEARTRLPELLGLAIAGTEIIIVTGISRSPA